MLIPTPTSGDLSLYFHLPFCEKKCDYCHFFVLPNKNSFKSDLLEGLLLEIELKASQLRNRKIRSIYFGGGTPALMGASALDQILRALEKYISLDSLEITLEFNPENHDLHLLKSYYNIGINRLSLGVQSFDADLLKKLSRRHSPLDSEKAIFHAKEAGFENISIDLMYDLPDQTLESWQATLSKAASLPIQHLSLYNLSIEKQTVFYKKRESIQKAMPSSELSLKMFEMASCQFSQGGWLPYEISAFCKHNAYSRHNVGYWLQRDHLGFGPSAFSLLKKKRFQNVKNLRHYLEALERKKLPIDYHEELEEEPFLRESLILNLRLYQGLNPDLFQERFGSFPLSLQDALKKLQDQRWIEDTSSTLKLTPEGRLYHDSLATFLV